MVLLWGIFIGLIMSSDQKGLKSDFASCSFFRKHAIHLSEVLMCNIKRKVFSVVIQDRRQ